MGQTPFYRASNELEHHFSNIERTRICSSINDRTPTPEFWLRTNGHQTSNLHLDLLNYSLNKLEQYPVYLKVFQNIRSVRTSLSAIYTSNVLRMVPLNVWHKP